MAARNFSAGTVFVQVLPSLDDWEDRVNKQLRDRLKGLKGQISVTPHLETKQFDNEVAGVQRKLAGLAGRSATVTLKANDYASAAIAKVGAQVKGLNGQSANVNLHADDHGSVDLLSTRLQRLIALSIAASGAIGGAAAGVVALAAGAAAGASGLAVLAIGGGQVVAAMKAQTQASRQLGQTEAQERVQRLSAANQVLNAQDALKNSSMAVANAQDTLRNATSRVANAQRDAATGTRTALEGQRRAEESLTAAQVSALRAQQDLTDARLDATRSIEDLQNQVIDDALSQRQAVLDLQDAELALQRIQADPTASERQREETQLTFDRAKQRLAEISLAYQRSQVDAAQASAAGVEGSQQVIAAQDAVVASQRELRQAQVDNAEASKRVDEARLDGAERVADAQLQVVHAQRSLAQAQQAAIAAQRNLGQAQEASVVQQQRQGAAAEKSREAMEKLSPQALNLIGYLRSQSGEWELLTKASQQFAPGLQAGIRELEPQFAAINENVGTLAKSTGEFLHVLGQGLAEAKPFFDTVSAASVSLFPRFGETVNQAARAVGSLVVQMLPLAPVALDTVDAISELITTWAPFIAQASGPLLTSLQDIIRNLDFLGPLLVALAKPAGDLTAALVGGLRSAFVNLTPALGPFLQSLVDIVGTLMPLIGSAGKLAAVAAQVLTPALQLTNQVLKPLVDLATGLVNILADIPTPVFTLVAGFVALRAAADPIGRLFDRMGKSVSTFGTAAGVASLSVGGSAVAAGRMATAGEKVGAVFSKVGNALPVVGLAFLGISSIFEAQAQKARQNEEAVNKLAAALLRGGDAATQARAHIAMLRDNATRFGGDVGEVFKRMADSAEQAAERQKNSMGTVELAQARVSQAQQDYDRAVREFGPTSDIARDYNLRLQGAVVILKDAQHDAAEATKSHTEKLQDQQDLLLGLTDANVAHERAKLRLQRSELRVAEAQNASKKAAEDVKVAQRELSAANRTFGKDSDQAREAQRKLVDAQEAGEQSAFDIKEAQLDLTSAQSNYVASAGAAAEATAKAGGAHDTAAARVRGQNQALVELMRIYGQDLPPSIMSMLGHIDAADQKFLGLNSRVDTAGQTILSLPGGPNQPPVEIKFTDNIPVVQSNIETLKQNLSGLGKWLDALLFSPGTSFYALQWLLQPPGTVPTQTPGAKPAPGSSLPGSLGGALGRADGGWVPGSGTGDTVPALLTPGEFVFSRPAVANLGAANVAGLHAAARGYAQGGLVGPLRFATGGSVPNVDDVDGSPLAWLMAMIATFEAITGVLNPLSVALRATLVPALDVTVDTSAELRTGMLGDWLAVTTAVGQSVQAITEQYLPTLRFGLALVAQAVTNTAAVWATQWGLIRGYAADPVRWALQFPFAALVAAWNRLDADFAMGKPIAPIPIPFAVGGTVPGSGDRDSVRAYLTPGEYVLSKPAIRNLGGLAAVDRLHQLARAGVIGPNQRLGGRSADGAARLRLMRTVPLDGLGFAYGGVQPHVAAAGEEIEQRFGPLPGGVGGVGPRPNVSDHPLGLALDFMTLQNTALGNQIAGYLQANAQRLLVKYLIWQQQINDGAGWSLMEDRGNLTANHFDHVHTSFLAAGLAGRPLGGTSPFDPAALVGPYFADAYRLVGQIATLFAGVMGHQTSGVATQAVDGVRAAAVAALLQPFGGVAAASGPVVEQVRAVARRYGWGEGAQWDALAQLVSHESSWNPNAQNPNSTAYGLFQFLDSTWNGYGIPKTSNPSLQAEAGMRYIAARYGDPLNAWRFWSANHWYDQGGLLPPGLSLAYNGTNRPEAVLTSQQWQTLHAGRGGGSFTGTLTLDSGEFLGMVSGQIMRSNESLGRSIARRTR